MNNIEKLIQKNLKVLEKKQNLNRSIFKDLGNKKIIDINMSKWHTEYYGGLGTGGGESYFQHRNLWYVLGKKEDLKKYIPLLILTDLDKKFIEKPKKYISQTRKFDGLLFTPMSRIISIDEYGKIDLKKFELNKKIDLAADIYTHGKIIDLNSMSNFLKRINIAEAIKNVDFSPNLIKNYCKDLTNLMCKINSRDRKVQNEFRAIIREYKAMNEWRIKKDEIVCGDSYFKLSKWKKGFLLNRRYEGSYRKEFSKQIKNLIFSCENHEDFLKKVKKQKRLLEKPIRAFLYKEIEYNNELLSKNHNFLNEKIFPYFNKENFINLRDEKALE